jgi:hypothetical protein
MLLVRHVETSGGTLRLEGRSMQTALAAGLVLLAAVLWAAGVDLASEVERNAAPLNWLAILYKLIGLAALLYVGWRIQSRSMRLLALLLALLTLGHLVIHSGLYGTVVHPVSNWLEGILPLSSGFIELAGMFLALAAIAGGLVWVAFRDASPFERPVVIRLILLLFVVGVFVGPVNAISVFGINREWLFAEDFGQAVALAVLAGYGVGLVVATGERSGSLVSPAESETTK